ncbi:hypothetical protein IRP63_01230 [Clostridium botulinum]|uniref:hypothetical protein n=1 Tax=Clostridium botulinum TaxID=1491 RepID=UPI000AEA9EB6|nr:hypothetical protein [Clostridium botulinum]MCD3232984.1 hypothetical protein [Clostridium botulinum D/C]MCD3239429.1 hypothetical protein [Clostridium botulinum D/C]MCD3266421.1 hypothetical protein [Clostridium botulinum D/C]MCD3301075.1 hypothetical protein [Clostridium botulinum D/C]MCD3304660.1 hypothetical protein [Clostridium botulinum D/C]
MSKITNIEDEIPLIKSLLISSSEKPKYINFLPDDMAKIWNSPKIKKSLSINSRLIDRVEKIFSEIYKIHGNDSKIIDTALLLALLIHKK